MNLKKFDLKQHLRETLLSCEIATNKPCFIDVTTIKSLAVGFDFSQENRLIANVY